MTPYKDIRVLIITRGRPGLLRACLESIFAGGAAPSVLVGIDGRDPASAAIASAFPGVETVTLPRTCRGEARNALIARARERWLCFLDDDTLLPPGYFERLSSLIKAHPEAAVFGGGQLPGEREGEFGSAVSALLASPWGSGPFSERFTRAAAERPAGAEKFILCNLTLDREFLAERGLSFEGHLTSAEENLLLGRMADSGAAMVLSGDLNLVHRRRNGPRAFAAQIFSSGRGRAQITFLRPAGLSAFTLLPPAALLSGCVLALHSCVAFAAAAAVYALVSAGAAFASDAPGRVKPAVFALFPVLHGAYAAGWLFGALESLPGLAGVRKVREWRCRCEGKHGARPR